MPAKSKAQLGMLFHLQEEGQLKPGTAMEFARSTPNIRRLPEHVGDKKTSGRKRAIAALRR